MTISAPIRPAPAPPDSASQQPGRARLAAIDVVRGVVMVLMALDHVRDFVTAQRFPPEDLSRASVALFATRWVTHFCAPAFFLLAGLGVGLMLRRRSRAETSRFLVTRGLWLVLLELTLTAIGWRFSTQLLPAFALVLWALGWSMVLLAVLLHLPRIALAVLVAVTIAGHNLLDGVQSPDLGALAPLWHLLHAPGFALPSVLLVGYPLVPWFAVMALGMLLADGYAWDDARRRRLLVWGGLAATALFVAARAANGYGDPSPWSTQRTPGLTVASFLNATKYPPSLVYLLMTLGPTLVALALAERARGRVAAWLAVIGRVPLFFYVLHIFAAHVVAMLLSAAQGNGFRPISMMVDPAAVPATHGVSLPGVYLAWALVVVLLYPACRWFGRLKRERDAWWLRYL